MQENINYFIDLFHKYVEPYKQEKEEARANVNIKIIHTLKVLEEGREIAKELPKNLRFPLLLTCLFHDIGRFEQIRIYNTYRDADSCNHAELGVKVLKQEAFLNSLPKQIQNYVYVGVLLHNRFTISPLLKEDYKLITFGVRDADKLDILRVMVENFLEPQENADTIFMNVKNENSYSPKVVKNLLAGKPIPYADIKYVNDFKLLQGGWLNELHFKSSRKKIAERGYYDVILKDLPKTKEMEEAKKYIFNLLNQ